MRTTAILVLIAVAALSAQAQPKFEVASIERPTED